MHEYLHKNLENIKKLEKKFIRNRRPLSIVSLPPAWGYGGVLPPALYSGLSTIVMKDAILLLFFVPSVVKIPYNYYYISYGSNSSSLNCNSLSSFVSLHGIRHAVCVRW